MSRFLIVSFAGLALAFYELSGGADFQPPQPGTMAPATTATTAATPAQMTRTAARAPSDRRDTASNRIATRPAEASLPTPVLTPYSPPTAEVRVTQAFASVSTASSAGAIRAEARPETPRDLAPAATPPGTAPQRVTLNLTSNLTSGGLQIGPLAGGLRAMTAALPDTPQIRTVAAPEPLGDIRRIRASRANLRLGPGTQFPVLQQLLAGDQVRILSEDPSGWALLENPKTGQVGWIAASLLSAKRS